MDLPVTAEGIETQSQFERFRVIGCDVGQGSLFGAPSTPEQIDALLRAALPLCNVSGETL
jgi:EAL domain-containing protein (putative c-di-GMP-specific phosphodiesterase class I)